MPPEFDSLKRANDLEAFLLPRGFQIARLPCRKRHSFEHSFLGHPYPVTATLIGRLHSFLDDKGLQLFPCPAQALPTTQSEPNSPLMALADSGKS